MDIFLVVLLWIVGVAITVAAFIFGVHVVVWNVNDIAEKGATFWNVFWIMLVGILFWGGTSKAASSSSN